MSVPLPYSDMVGRGKRRKASVSEPSIHSPPNPANFQISNKNQKVPDTAGPIAGFANFLMKQAIQIQSIRYFNAMPLLAELI